MEQRLWMILQLFGGAALFLYSMDTLTDALQQAAGDTLRQAIDKAYEQAAKVHFENAYCRKDIGQLALAAGEEK